jgi:hypothetical protein
MYNNYEDSFHEISDDSGDLHAWEYLTKTYDDPHMYTDYDECIVPSNTVDQNQPMSEATFGSIKHPTSMQFLIEMHTAESHYYPEEMTTPLKGVEYVTKSSSYPDLSLLHHDHQFQYQQHFKNQPLQQQSAVSSFVTVAPPGHPSTSTSSRPRPWSCPTLVKMPEYPKSFRVPPKTTLHSQNVTHPSMLLSQRPISRSEEYNQKLHQQQQYQIQYQQTTEEPQQQRHYQTMNAEPHHQHAVPIPHEWFTSLPSSTTDQVIPPSVALLDDFEPEPIHLSHTERVHTDEFTDLITNPTYIQGQNLAEMGTVQPSYRPEAIPTQMVGVQYITKTSSCLDLSLLQHDHQFQYQQNFKNQHLQQIRTVNAVAPLGDPSHQMLENIPGYSKRFAEPHVTLLHSQNWSHPSIMLSQQPTCYSEEYFLQQPQSTSRHQQQQHQLQYQPTMEEPLQNHHDQPMNVEPPLHRAVPGPQEWFTSLPSSSTDQVFPPSVAVLDDFEPEPIYPAHMADTASRNPSPTKYYSRKRGPPQRSKQKGSTEYNIDIASPDEEVYHLELPSFVYEVLPPYQQHQNTRLLLRPLTAYNYFYRDERENIVRNFTMEDDPLPPPQSNFTTNKMHSLVYEHWYADPIKEKRSHRKSHGKVSFETLSKTIAQRWHNLPDEGREFYRNVSFLDNVYYQQELLKIKEHQ